jgi:hypothetical protein
MMKKEKIMKKNKIKFPLIYILVFIFCFSLSLQAQFLSKAVNDNETPPTILDYPAGSGWIHMVAGDYWTAWIGANQTGKYLESGVVNTSGARYFMFIGGTTSSKWSAAGGNYPNAFPYTPWWSQFMGPTIYDPDTTVCRDSVNKKANLGFYSNGVENTGEKYSKYMIPAYNPKIPGGNDPTRYYNKEAYYVDGKLRNHLVAEGGWPTNVGLDVKFRAHQFAAPNWNNLNDFVIIEFSFKNTGVIDINMDGTAEKTDHKIPGFMFYYGGVPAHSIGTDLSGIRVENTSATTVQRLGGYISDPDPDGNPWDFTYINAGQSELPPTKQDMGFNCAQNHLKDYIDQYSGHTFIAVRKGGLPTDIAKGTSKNERKNTIYGTDAIGIGPQRGWFKASGCAKTLYTSFSTSAPKYMWWQGIGKYFEAGGWNEDPNGDVNQKPNPAFFDTTKNNKKWDYLNWVPKTITPNASQKPNGDKSCYSDRIGLAAFQNLVDEQGMEDKSKPYTAGWGKHTTGYNTTFNFDGAIFSAVGPLSLDVGEEITVVFVLAGGYRLEGLQKAIRAARYAYENDYAIPTPPPVPDMKLSNTLTQTVNIEWDNQAETDPKFTGYKIWKAANYMKYKYIDDGMRLIDKFQEQMAPGEDKAKYKKPVNPKFNAYIDVMNSANKGVYPGYYWGTYELIKNIPKSELNNYKSATTSGYTYLFEDKAVLLGFTYYYYISAYSEGTFTGPGGETTNRIETHMNNRNGASGLWEGTYPYATNYAAYYPKDTNLVGRKKIGAPIVVSSPTKTYDELNTKKYKIGVRPNPYKKAALHDNYTNVFEHQLFFYNLPPKCKITILDVAGRIIDIINFSTTDPTKGSTFWKMFSKDGVEVASGYYVYIVEWDGGSTSGIFSILR